MDQLIVFDLDGTLVDSAEDLRAALNRLLVEEGRRELSRAEIMEMVGDGAPKLVQRGFAATGAAFPEADILPYRRRFLDFYEADIAVHTRPYPGVPETLDTLAALGWRFAVCTNKPQAATEAVLAALGMTARFDAVIGGDAVENRKPHGDHVRAVLNAAAFANGRAVMVGDSENDIVSGRAAGLPTIAVSYGFGAPSLADAGADHTIDRFEDIMAVLAS